MAVQRLPIMSLYVHCMQEKERMFEFGEPLLLSDARADVSRKLTFLEWLATTVLKPHV